MANASTMLASTPAVMTAVRSPMGRLRSRLGSSAAAAVTRLAGRRRSGAQQGGLISCSRLMNCTQRDVEGSTCSLHG